MNNIARFEKVSFEEFAKCFPGMDHTMVADMYNNIQLPTRSTGGSAGYDFRIPMAIVVDGVVKIPTGIKCCIEPGWVLMLFPRSSLGMKFGSRLMNTVGIVDADYYNNPSNEGHIMCAMTCTEGEMPLASGEKFVQGIFLPFGLTVNDIATGDRVGGFGSTGKA